MLLERLSKIGMACYQYYHTQKDPAIVKTIEECLEFFEQSLKNKEYFAGKEPGWVDYMIWPWMERMSAIAILSEGKLAVNNGKCPKLAQYYSHMVNRPEVRKVMQSGEMHYEFFKDYVKGNPPFDLGLDD